MDTFMDYPTNVDELYEVLKAFKEQDANGNGDPNDEIPLRKPLMDRNGLICIMRLQDLWKSSTMKKS